MTNIAPTMTTDNLLMAVGGQHQRHQRLESRVKGLEDIASPTSAAAIVMSMNLVDDLGFDTANSSDGETNSDSSDNEMLLTASSRQKGRRSRRGSSRCVKAVSFCMAERVYASQLRGCENLLTDEERVAAWYSSKDFKAFEQGNNKMISQLRKQNTRRRSSWNVRDEKLREERNNIEKRSAEGLPGASENKGSTASTNEEAAPCVRGLEDHLSIRAGLDAKARKVCVRQAVFDEQTRQRQQNVYDPEALRKLSRAASKASRNMAVDFAHQDAREARPPTLRRRRSSAASRSRKTLERSRSSELTIEQPPSSARRAGTRNYSRSPNKKIIIRSSSGTIPLAAGAEKAKPRRRVRQPRCSSMPEEVCRRIAAQLLEDDPSLRNL